MKSSARNVKLASVDDLFTTEENRQELQADAKREKVQMIPLAELHSFRNHPFKVSGGFIDSASNFGLIRGGHVDACFLGALEVDAEGNLANWIIPGKKMPGMGGAMDLCVGAKHCIVCMEHTAKGNPKIFEKCRLPLTASHCVNKIITEMCVFEVTENGLLMTEINPEFTVDQIKEATAAPFEVAVDLKSMLD